MEVDGRLLCVDFSISIPIALNLQTFFESGINTGELHNNVTDKTSPTPSHKLLATSTEAVAMGRLEPRLRAVVATTPLLCTILVVRQDLLNVESMSPSPPSI